MDVPVTLELVLTELRQLRTRLDEVPKKDGVPRGYVRGAAAAAKYLGIDRGTFRGWRDDDTMKNRNLLQPRIIRGEAYYKLEALDRFMDPRTNPLGSEVGHPFGPEN